jgi:uncharacterized protein YijF (DUF1287 family)
MQTIEYIGPRPRKKPKKSPLGRWVSGWLMILLAVGIAFFFAQPMLPFLRAQQNGASDARATVLMSELTESKEIGDRLAAAALAQTLEPSTYDPAYYKISYPGGDIPAGKGIGPDVIVRAYRTLGCDLQVAVHEDMTKNFRVYPQLFKLREPDPNIDHRRVANLQRFFSRHGEELSNSREPAEYKTGDIVAWRLAGDATHIGVVVPGPGTRRNEPWVVHNIGAGPVWENSLLNFQIIGHYRFKP